MSNKAAQLDRRSGGQQAQNPQSIGPSFAATVDSCGRRDGSTYAGGASLSNTHDSADTDINANLHGVSRESLADTLVADESRLDSAFSSSISAATDSDRASGVSSRSSGDGLSGLDGDAATEVDTVHLQVPGNDKLWLISPPGSPPVGWTSIREQPPNALTMADDLFAALRKLEHITELNLDGSPDGQETSSSSSAPLIRSPPPRPRHVLNSPAPGTEAMAFHTGDELHPTIVIEDWSAGAGLSVLETDWHPITLGGGLATSEDRRHRGHNLHGAHQRHGRIPQTALPPLTGIISQ